MDGHRSDERITAADGRSEQCRLVGWAVAATNVILTTAALRMTSHTFGIPAEEELLVSGLLGHPYSVA